LHHSLVKKQSVCAERQRVAQQKRTKKKREW
jgi:hypothetical protein